jgi:hypothetical protein
VSWASVVIRDQIEKVQHLLSPCSVFAVSKISQLIGVVHYSF